MKPVHSPTDPWSKYVPVSRQNVMDLYECAPADLLNGGRVHTRLADRCYAQATRQATPQRKQKHQGKALWHLCQGAFCHLMGEAMLELHRVEGKEYTQVSLVPRNLLEKAWAEAMRRAQAAAQVGATHSGRRN